MSGAYEAVLDVSEGSVLFLTMLLRDGRLARDNGISSSPAYAYRDEGIAVLAALAPSLHGALLAAKVAGCSHVIEDGTLIRPTGSPLPALRHYRGCPWRLGDIVGAALVLLHHENHRTT